MNTQATQAAPIPLVSSSPVGAEEKADLELMLEVDITADWSAIRQCLRCLTQGSRIDSVGEDLRVTPTKHRRLTGREAARAVVIAAKAESLSPLAAARKLAFTPAGLERRAEWDAWWKQVEADKVARLKAEAEAAEKANQPKE